MRVTGTVLLAWCLSGASLPAFAQENCPSGILIHVSSASEFISVWSAVSGGDYGISRAWNIGTHVGRDRYSLDVTMPGNSDLGKPAYLPFTARVWTAYNGPYGYTVLAWDPGSGIVIRLAHLNEFSSTIRGANGGWFGAGTKVGYIGETGCPGCGPHLHMSAYRGVLVGAAYGNRSATESDIVSFLSAGQTPQFAQAQKFRLIAPSDHCDVLKFDDSPALYANKWGTLHPISEDAWRSWGMTVNLNPQEGELDQQARVVFRTLPGMQRSSYRISTQLADPRTDSVFVGTQYADTYVFRWGQKRLLNANEFGTQPWHEFRWSEVQRMQQWFVDQVHPRTQR